MAAYHHKLIATIRQRWREERERGWYNPPDELATNLDDLEVAALIDLGTRIRQRLDARKHVPALPPGWFWVGRWRAWSAWNGETAHYHDAADAIRATKKQHRGTGQPPRPPAPDALFEDD